MSENRPNRPENTGNPWMRPMGAQQLTRRERYRQAPAPLSPYTPNEADGNEAVYAARAAAARQQAANRQMPAYRTPEAPAPVQQAVEQAAMQAHAARMNARPQQPAPQMQAARPAQPVQPYQQVQRPQATNAVFYQQATGVQQQPARPAQPAQPVQPHRMPMNPYAYAAQPVQNTMPQQQPMRQPAAEPVQTASISRQADASALADPMLMVEAAQTGTPRRRSRMVMRQEQELPQQQASGPITPPEDRRIFERPVEPAKEELSFPAFTPEMQMPIPAATPEPQPEPLMPELPEMPELEPLQATSTEESIADPDQPPENPLKRYSWYTSDEEDEEEDCMDTSAMPIPVPVNTFDIPKVKRGKKLFTLLLVAMLLAAAAGFLWVSGYGEKLYHGAIELVQNLKSDAVSTGALTISPETAALPAIVTVSLTTEENISSLKLVDGDGNELPAQVAYTAHEDGIQWICTLRMSEPYTGPVCTQLLCEDGQWRPGSEKGHLTVE